MILMFISRRFEAIDLLHACDSEKSMSNSTVCKETIFL